MNRANLTDPAPLCRLQLAKSNIPRYETRKNEDMIYHLAYDGTVTYSDFPMRFNEIPAEADLSRLDWEPSGVSLDSELLQLAMRGARIGDRGLYFPMDNWSARIQLDELKRTHQDDVKSRSQRLAMAEEVGRVIDSQEWSDVARQDEATMEQEINKLVSKFQGEINSILERPVAADVRDACVSHGLPVI